MTRKNLRMFVISHPTNRHANARAVCRLSFNFPDASMNWWHELNSSKADPLFTKTVIKLSASLPFNVVDYHYCESCKSRIARSKF